MIYLILSILSSTVILILFRLFKSFEVNTKIAILFNYISAFVFGIWSHDQPVTVQEVISSDWIYGSLFLGLLFIVIFNLMAITAQKNGLSVVSVASKMSVIIPISLGVYLYNEQLNTLQIIGIVLALIAVYCTSLKSNEEAKNNSLLLPILVFLGSGVIDGSLKYFENYHVPDDMIAVFSACIFMCAAIFGIIYIFGIERQKWSAINLKSGIAGVVLGVINFYSIYFLLQALKIDWLNSATVFTINNVSIVTMSSLVGYLIFKEHISKLNLTGIALAIVSIYLISL